MCSIVSESIPFITIPSKRVDLSLDLSNLLFIAIIHVSICRYSWRTSKFVILFRGRIRQQYLNPHPSRHVVPLLLAPSPLATPNKATTANQIPTSTRIMSLGRKALPTASSVDWISSNSTTSPPILLHLLLRASAQDADEWT